MQIAYDYGERLNKMTSSLKKKSLVNLVSNYPSHGFVIDRKEAGELFKNVVSPEGITNDIYLLSRGIVEKVSYPDSPMIINIKEMLLKEAETQEQESKSEKGNVNDERIKKQGNDSDKKTKRKSKKNESDINQSNKTGDDSGNSGRKNEIKALNQSVN